MFWRAVLKLHIWRPQIRFITPGRLTKMDITFDFNPPQRVKGMQTLSKSLFSKEVMVPRLTFEPGNEAKINFLIKKLKPFMLKIRQIKPIETQNNRTSVLFDPRKRPETSILTLTDEDLAKAVPELEAEQWDLSPDYPLRLTYENWSADEIIRAILPDELPAVSGFAIVGHVAHLNLKEGHLPYKSLIGQIILDKHKNIETVVNKLDTIDNTYRNFQMEVLAGKDDLNVTVRENNCSYQFDFSKVYWNSRLGTEHERIVMEVTRNTVVYDVFAGVGPFAIPSAKKGALVYANDLNPESYKSLCKNIIVNRIKGKCHTYNMDGREFIRTIMAETLDEHLLHKRQILVIMNLPALALEFTDSFLTLLGDSPKDMQSPPLVYCYCFSKVDDGRFEEDAAQRANNILKLDDYITATMCRRVRNVAPNKEMLCIKFPLKSDILYRSTQTGTKRLKHLGRGEIA